MIEYRTLDSVPLEAVRECFLRAFADYFVKFSPSLEDFRGMNDMRGVDYSASMGVFEDGALAGFTLNGLGDWRGRRTAYDAGTAVIKSSRGQGYSTEIFNRLIPLLKSRGIEDYLLEVIDGNDGALRLYRSLGFEVTRRFACMKLDAGAFKPGRAADVEISGVPPAGWAELRAAMEDDDGFLPSWQNSWDSLNRMPGRFAVKAAWSGGELAGYGVVSPSSGSVPQLWVKSSSRGRGIGSALLADMAGTSNKAGALSWLNIEESRSDVLDFLEARGFTRTLSQYEMQRPL